VDVEEYIKTILNEQRLDYETAVIAIMEKFKIMTLDDLEKEMKKRHGLVIRAFIKQKCEKLTEQGILVKVRTGVGKYAYKYRGLRY